MLTDLQIRTAKPGASLYKLADGRGLYVSVAPSGRKTWRATYRVGGISKTATFGEYPDITLSEARDKIAALKTELRRGADPYSKIEGATFGEISREMVERKVRAGSAERTIESNKLLLRHLSNFDARELATIKPAELMALLRTIEDEGKRETARRVRGMAGAVFRYAAATGRGESDPTSLLRGALLPAKRTPRAAILSPDKFARLLVDIDKFDGFPTIKGALQFAALVFVRPGEIRAARWSQFSEDVWKIPEEIMKQRRPHEVPLSRQAKAVLGRMKAIRRGELVFPSLRPGDRPLSENTLNSALRYMGYAKDQHTAHGFRATASTMLNEKGYSKDVIEIQLSHLDKDEVRRAYNRALHWPERVKMMQDWANYLDELKIGDSV
jgi:integrase